MCYFYLYISILINLEVTSTFLDSWSCMKKKTPLEQKE